MLKYSFLQVAWKLFYNTRSISNIGTLCQLCSAINRRDISASANSHYNASNDFFLLVVRCHIVAAAMQFFTNEFSFGNTYSSSIKGELVVRVKGDEKGCFALGIRGNSQNVYECRASILPKRQKSNR